MGNDTKEAFVKITGTPAFRALVQSQAPTTPEGAANQRSTILSSHATEVGLKGGSPGAGAPASTSSERDIGVDTGE